MHLIAGSGHNDGFAMVYLPAEKILIEVDAYAPPAATRRRRPYPSPFAVNLYDNIQRLKLDVRQIAALHGPRVATMDDLRAFIGQRASRTSVDTRLRPQRRRSQKAQSKKKISRTFVDSVC